MHNNTVLNQQGCHKTITHLPLPNWPLWLTLCPFNFEWNIVKSQLQVISLDILLGNSYINAVAKVKLITHANSMCIIPIWNQILRIIEYITDLVLCINGILVDHIKHTWFFHYHNYTVLVQIFEGRIFCGCHKFSIFTILFLRITGFTRIILKI